jgi:hypothetical protein
MNNGTVRTKEYIPLKEAAARAGVPYPKLRRKLHEKGYLTSGFIAKKEFIAKEYFLNELKEFYKGDVRKQYEAVLVSGYGFSIVSELADEIKAETAAKKAAQKESKKACHAA